MRKADNLPPYCAVVKKSRSLNFLDPSGPAWPVTGVIYVIKIRINLELSLVEIQHEWNEMVVALTLAYQK